MGIPLIWMLLPTAGNSNTAERTGLLDRLRAAFPDTKFAALMGDREFIGDAWMAFLHREKIAFILRLRENQSVLREGYAAMRPQPVTGLCRFSSTMPSTRNIACTHQVPASGGSRPFSIHTCAAETRFA